MAKKLIQFDWAIKHILRQKANFEILEGFLSELLNEDIKIHSILESEANQELASDKSNRVDILTMNANKELVLVEIQNNYEHDYFHRMVYGAAKVVTEYLKIGESYAKVKKVISVNIVYFNLGDGEDYIYKGKTEFLGMLRNDILQPTKKQKERFEITTVSEIFPQYYVIKLGNFKHKDNKNADQFNGLDEWMYFLKNSEVPMGCHAKGLTQATQVLDKLVLSEEELRLYDRHLDAVRVNQSEAESAVIIHEELEETKEELVETKEELVETKEELQQEKIKNIKMMLRFNVPIKEIMAESGFTEADILRITNQ